jgi:selenium metabolism protein YedF
MEIIDVLGKSCPVPVIEAKKALAKRDISQILVKVDNSAAVENLKRMAESLGYGFSCSESAKGLYEALITKNSDKTPGTGDIKDVPEAAFGCIPTGGMVVVISKNTMGGGAEELGQILVKGFIYALTELPVPPGCLIFLNSGAYLTSEGANTIADLQKLAEKGTQILTCGTCANYYNLQDKLAVGSLTNMYAIAEKMANAASVINI